MHRELILTDFLSLLLKKLRVILLAGVIAAVLLGGFRFVRLSASNQPSGPEEEQIQLDQENLRIAELELAELEHSRDSLQAYTSDSIYYQMNGYEVWSKEIVFSVETDYKIIPGQYYQDPDRTGKFVAAYTSGYKDSNLYKELRQLLGQETDTRYLDELISVSTVEQGLVKITTIHSEQATASSMADRIFAFLQEKVTGSLGDHRTVVVSELSNNRVYNDLLALQKAKREERKLLLQSIAEKEDQLEKQRASLQQTEDNTLAASMKGAFTYAVFGGVLGCGAAYFILFLSHLTNTRLSGSRDVEAHYNIPLLANLQRDKRAKRRLFETLIRRLDGETATPPAPEDGIRLADSAVRSLSGKSGATVMVTGTCDAALLEEIAGQLSGASDGRTVYKPGACVLVSPETVEEAGRVDGIVLVEQAEKSEIKTVDRQITSLERGKTPIIGMILLS